MFLGGASSRADASIPAHLTTYIEYPFLKHKMTSLPNVSMMDALKADVQARSIEMIEGADAVLRAGASSSMAEHRTFNPLVQGSSPWGPTKNGTRVCGVPFFVCFWDSNP